MYTRVISLSYILFRISWTWVDGIKLLGDAWSPQGLYFRYIHEGVVRVGFVNRQDISHDGVETFYDKPGFLIVCFS
jgi:hypothetical protein